MASGKKEKFLIFNSLVSVVKGLEGHYTTIDLRNEACLTGKIVNVDGLMNVELEDVVLYDPRGSEHPFESFFINCRLIRYVHIPKELSAAEIAKKQIGGLIVPRRTTMETNTFRRRRAERYQKQTIESLRPENK